MDALRIKKVIAIAGSFLIITSQGFGAFVSVVTPSSSQLFDTAQAITKLTTLTPIPTAYAGSGGGSGGGDSDGGSSYNRSSSSAGSSSYASSGGNNDEYGNEENDDDYHVPAVAQDLANCVTGASGTIDCAAQDVTPPTISIQSPKDGEHMPFDQDTMQVKATAKDDTDPQPTITGTGNKELKSGVNTISVTARDASGNTWTETVTVIRDAENAVPATPTSTWKDGTYSGIGYYVFGSNSAEIKVRIAIKNNKITTISFVSFPTSPAVAASDFDSTFSTILSTQKPIVNTVTGASGTSDAVQHAIDAALSQSKEGAVKPVEAPAAVPTVSASPAGGTFNSAQVMVLKTNDPAATMYYTTNGSAPTAQDTVYTRPVPIARSLTVKYVAMKGNTPSAVGTATFQITALESRDFADTPRPLGWGAVPDTSQIDTVSTTANDVSKNHWAYEPIKRLAVAGVISGYADGSFRPDQTVNRAEGIKMLVEAMGLGLHTQTVHDFRDVPRHAWYAPYVQTAIREKLINGDAAFRPSDTLTRAEAVKIIVTAMGAEKVAGEFPQKIHFTDVDQIAWYAIYAEFARANSIVSGYADGRFGGGDAVTRAQMAKMLVAAWEIAGSKNLNYVPTLKAAEVLAIQKQRDADIATAAAAHAQHAQRIAARPTPVQTSAAATPRATQQQNTSAANAAAKAAANIAATKAAQQAAIARAAAAAAASAAAANTTTAAS